MASRFAVTTDPAHGGRWTSLTDPSGRQWLWSRPTPDRDRVSPGDPFVDAGGLEECFPTIGPDPDHGDIWSRPWMVEHRTPTSEQASVTAELGFLRRTITTSDTAVVGEYELQAEPGTAFIWAAHALLELPVGSGIIASPGAARAFPDHAEPVETTWPRPLGLEFDRFPENDGTAMFCVLPDRGEVRVEAGLHSLRMRLTCPGQPVSIGVWRNLGGYPWDGPTYRNIGIEPMIGRVFDIHRARDGDTGVVPRSGRLRWRLEIDNP